MVDAEEVSSQNVSVVERLKVVDAATVSNGIDLIGIRSRQEGFASLDLRCCFPELGVMCGYAVTAQVETVTLAADTSDLSLCSETFMELFEAVNRASKPAVVVFQEVGGQRDRAAHCGEIMATTFKLLGAVGVVSDCGIRDVDQMRAMGFQAFARGYVASCSYFRILRVGVPVTVAELDVRPGDLLHGDTNGLVSIPTDHVAEILSAVDHVRKEEKVTMDLLKQLEKDPKSAMKKLRSAFGGREGADSHSS